MQVEQDHLDRQCEPRAVSKQNLWLCVVPRTQTGGQDYLGCRDNLRAVVHQMCGLWHTRGDTGTLGYMNKHPKYDEGAGDEGEFLRPV